MIGGTVKNLGDFYQMLLFSFQFIRFMLNRTKIPSSVFYNRLVDLLKFWWK